ncbi:MULTISPECIES: DUF6694 family lipoprotein [Halomonas]|uniref:DUF6694 family lipoprotein n=1 Tax=Halomonas TaxID=2745 RepID=UPI002686540C|nr:DUF6694 family lipoprotein [Halomonas citrativorans]
MWSLLRLSAITLSLCVLAGCSDPKIDTSSMPAAVVSIENVREAMPAYKRDEFDKALAIMAMPNFGSMALLSPKRMNAAEIAESANVRMHGLTGDQVIKRADDILRERRARERQQALSTLSRLTEKQARADKDREQRERFSIDNARYYISQSPYGTPEPALDIEVTNHTEQAVSQVFLRGVVTSADRSAPWIDETFYYVIAGGLEAGETATWRLAPNRFSAWGNTQIPSDVSLTVTVKGLQDAQGNPLWDSPELSKSEVERLEHLSHEYQGIALSTTQ